MAEHTKKKRQLENDIISLEKEIDKAATEAETSSKARDAILLKKSFKRKES